jgi:hypothetical protein
VKAAAAGLLAALFAAQPQSGVPNVGDLKITTRRTSGSLTWTETTYFKGPRQRHDSSATEDTFTTILDCHDRRRIMIHRGARTYAAMPVESIHEHIARLSRTARSNPLPEATGPEVVTTIDAVDTGERRQHGRYTARHVVTTITVEAAPGAQTRSTIQKRDGWTSTSRTTVG